MMNSKVSTLTSGVLAIANSSLIDDKETIELNVVNSSAGSVQNILVIDKNYNTISNHDEIIHSIYSMGFKIVISDSFTNIFSAKAINSGILAIEVSRVFLDKIIKASQESSIKLFIDLKGQEVMIINTGEKEYFDLSDYNKESLENGMDDVENLYAVWEGIDHSYKYDDMFEYALE